MLIQSPRLLGFAYFGRQRRCLRRLSGGQAKWIASFLVDAPLEQMVMGVMAVVVAYVALGVALDYWKTNAF